MMKNKESFAQSRHLLESKRRIDYHKNSRHSSVKSPNQDLYSARKAAGSRKQSPINENESFKRTVYQFNKRKSDVDEFRDPFCDVIDSFLNQRSTSQKPSTELECHPRRMRYGLRNDK